MKIKRVSAILAGVCVVAAMAFGGSQVYAGTKEVSSSDTGEACPRLSGCSFGGHYIGGRAICCVAE